MGCLLCCFGSKEDNVPEIRDTENRTLSSSTRSAQPSRSPTRAQSTHGLQTRETTYRIPPCQQSVVIDSNTRSHEDRPIIFKQPSFRKASDSVEISTRATSKTSTSALQQLSATNLHSSKGIGQQLLNTKSKQQSSITTGYQPTSKIGGVTNISGNLTSKSFTNYQYQQRIEQSLINTNLVPNRQVSYESRRRIDDYDDDDVVVDYYDDTIPTSYAESENLRDVLNNNFVPSDWSPMLPNEELKFEMLSSHWSSEFSLVSHLFKQTTKKKNLNITKIERVQNPYLWGCYKLKKEEMENRYASVNARVQEMRLFHGTRKANIRSICAGNMDWRKCGSSIGNRYGQGVSFSPIAFYSSHYTDKHTFEENAMLLCKVLVAKEIRGHGDMVLPPVNLSTGFNCDTSIKQDRQVYVKYSDHEFYPEYVIYYTTY